MSYNQVGIAAYQRDDVFTASPLRLVCLTMNGVMSRIDRCRRALKTQDKVQYRHELNRARALISELLGALDKNLGGEIATQLEALYEFQLTRLLTIGPEMDPRKLDNAYDIMKTIKEGFDAILATGAEQQTVGR